MAPMQSTPMDTVTPDVPEVETLLVESDQGGTRADLLSPLRARAVSVVAVLLLVAGCLALASAAAREPVKPQVAPGGLVRLVKVDGKAKGKPQPVQAKENASKASEKVATLSEDDCAQIRTLFESAKGGKAASLASLKAQGIDITEFGPGADPCQVIPALAKAKATAKFDEAMDGGSKAEKKARRNTTSVTTTTTTSTHTTSTRTTVQTTDPCSGDGQDCRNTTCCSLKGMQCYEKSKEWAQCKVTCVPGKDPSDVDSAPWTCKELGKRTPGEPATCSEVSENCITSKCCTGIGFACYAKNETFATCKASCTPGPDYMDEDGFEPWTCQQLGDSVPGKGPWVDEECANDEDDCREAACCQTSGHQCYEMGEGWAQCKADCSTEPENAWDDAWTCKEIGQRTPPSAWDVAIAPRNGKVATWVRDRCSREDDDCTHTQCCTEVGAVCYKKDATYGKCMTACDPSMPGYDDWACEESGSRSFGVARKTWPSLFCFSVIRLCAEKNCYELSLMNRIYELGPDSAGIFGCDDWNVFANEPAKVGGRDATQIKGNISVGISKDGTAANTELFMAVWELVIDDGRFRMHDWTVKMDPDAVLLPWKLGDHLAPHTNNGEHDGRLYVVNCNAWPDSDSFPMMYGSVEIFSKGAMTAYAANMQARCADYFQWEDWGEDYFITRCMDQLDVGRLDMFDLVGDNVCVGPGQGGTGDCSEGERAAFHPFKDIEVWTNCYNNAVGFHPETPAPAPPEEGQEGGEGDWQQQEGA